ncbi:MAG: hypothetical protein IJP92_05825 [Lachnospiraceae bacterium]|nr:hypothetical protein [Lachnospiraceae bacterium]
MDRPHYREMMEALEKSETEDALRNKTIFLFGHADASLTLADELLSRGYKIRAILDNSDAKQGIIYKDIPVCKPDIILTHDTAETIVCIVSRFFESMRSQLRTLGFTGRIEKLVDYNSYAAYDLSEETIREKRARVERGKQIVEALEKKHPGCFKIYCPFAALGDIYYMMSYLPHFMKMRFGEGRRPVPVPLVCISSVACAKVVSLFGGAETEVLPQQDLDAAVQASLYIQEKNFFIAHQDRPYVVNLINALYLKCIPLEQIYCCGIFGLPKDTKAVRPAKDAWQSFDGTEGMQKGNSVIFSPYAKSVPSLPPALWDKLVDACQKKGYDLFTNVAPGEAALQGTKPLSADLTAMRPVVEHAGVFIGIRSGLCDLLLDAECKKAALFPDYYYMDTGWKAIEMYSLTGWYQPVVRNDADMDETVHMIMEGLAL